MRPFLVTLPSKIGAVTYIFAPVVTAMGFVAAQWQEARLWIDEAGRRRHAPLREIDVAFAGGTRTLVHAKK